MKRCSVSGRGFLRGLEDVGRALDVDLLEGLPVRRRGHPTEMEHPVATGDRGFQRRQVREVGEVLLVLALHVLQPLEVAGLTARDADLVAGFQQFLDQPRADEPGGAGDEANTGLVGRLARCGSRRLVRRYGTGCLSTRCQSCRVMEIGGVALPVYHSTASLPAVFPRRWTIRTPRFVTPLRTPAGPSTRGRDSRG